MSQSATNHLEILRLQVINRLADLLEGQTRTQFYATSLSELILSVHHEITGTLNQALGSGNQDVLNEAMQYAATTCTRLDDTLSLLFSERSRQWQQGGEHLRALMSEINGTIASLSTTLIEKDLLERQSRVLERIILSHERVAQWKEFVQEILLDFHAIFPFNFFFIAFAEEHGLSVYLYYIGTYSEEVRRQASEMLSRRMLIDLGLPANTPLDIEEFIIPNAATVSSVDDIHLLTVSVPEHAPKLAGLLGVAYASNATLLPQEQSVISSILAVMVMVVGSSKILSRTLAELEYYSMHDPLTGLYNRRHFNAMLEYEVGRSERHNHSFSLLLLDLDDFKDVNDSYGHPTGDQALVAVAEVLRAHLRKGDLPTRIGGDEFAVILVETDQQGALKVADTMGRNLRELTLNSENGKSFHLTVSIGVITYPQDGESISDLLTGVDVAMYRAKELGKDGFSTIDTLKDRIQINRNTRDQAEHLRVALQEQRIVPYFQSIIDCKSGDVFAFETVARLKELDGQTISAATFIETIEKYGLSRDLDQAIINKAFATKRENMLNADNPEVKLFINLSAQEIQGRGILGYAEELCNKLAIPAHCIVFEILERDAISDMTNMRRFLTNLRRKGFAFALDDFGSGYNSFHYLRELRFEYVKIDGAFVRNILNSSVDYALVRNLSNLCQDIGIRTVAEFVENQEIFDALCDMGIDYAQGYHIGMPLPEMCYATAKNLAVRSKR
ncbi:bifunctional diguanylate cyclase/phosphodiesterase [Methylomonas sp. LL1]|uniref:putative bifunctional diguanylate cyclase/phosphodiesterase n=1 Tax=Methylomonas sp. LL1 TaxID=2785785 RepID=UPI0018C450C1|nr:bifunctional diguanylate cyclase/phosphodiesterase [Methylomonas sp. LL1]QPK62994.1 bifunctional diguanylate cyclase/phosphodiesterase [Methylomonas sp. LL1]